MNGEQCPNHNRPTARLKWFGSWFSPIFHYAVRVASHYALMAILLPGAALAQRFEPRSVLLDPAQAEREARALVADMLSQQPVQTNTGLLKIRDAKGRQKEWPMRFEIWSVTNSSTSIYEATDPQTQRKTKLTVRHFHGQPNQYFL